jgi:hypothetical protein
VLFAFLRLGLMVVAFRTRESLCEWYGGRCRGVRAVLQRFGDGDGEDSGEMEIRDYWNIDLSHLTKCC